MLYGTNARSEGSSDKDPEAIPGLAAITPHSANTTTGGSSGGTIGVAGAGNAGGVPAGSSPFGTTQGPGTKPSDRNSGFLTKRGGVRVFRQPAENAARLAAGQQKLSPISPIGGSPFTSPIGLSGLEGMPRFLTPPRKRERIVKAVLAPATFGLSLAAPDRWLKFKRDRSQPQQKQGNPFIPKDPQPGVYYPTGMGDLGAGFFQRITTIPRSPANIAKALLAVPTFGASFAIPTRVFTPPRRIDAALRQGIDTVLPKPITDFASKAVRYGVVGTQVVMFPWLTGSMQRQIFGLDPKESRVFMKGQQIMRIIDAAVLAVAGGWVAFGGGSASGAAGTSGAAFGSGAPGAPWLTPAVTHSAVATGGSVFGTSSVAEVGAGSGILYTSAATPAALPVASNSPIIAAVAAKESLGVAALKGIGTVAATVATQAGINAFSPQPQGGVPMQPAGQGTYVPENPAPYAGGAPSGGGSAGDPGYQEASMGVMAPALLGIAVTVAGGWIVERMKKRRKS